MRAYLGAQAGEARTQYLLRATYNDGRARQGTAGEHIDFARAHQVEFARKRILEPDAVDNATGSGVAVDAGFHIA